MPRLHLFELCDQPWLPRVVRDAETRYLAAAIALGRPFKPLAPKIADAMAAARTDRIVDLASGGAGPWPALASDVASAGSRTPSVTLTDLFPNVDAYQRAGVAFEATPVDARNVPAHLDGVRTMFDGLHHLRPVDARAVLADAHRARQPIVIGEALSRRLPMLLSTLLIPLFVLLLTPRARPTPLVLVLTYLVPILPLVIAWDGFVSCLRTYTPRELEAMTDGLDGYRWEAGTVRHRGATMTYLVGAPAV
jgi:hypothetical protein